MNDLIDSLSRNKGISISLNQETSIVEKLESAGIHSGRLLQFLKQQAEISREKLEKQKSSLTKDEYYQEKLIINEVEILILYLENSL